MKCTIFIFIVLFILNTVCLVSQKKSSNDETVFYDITIQFDGSAECEPCDGPYLTKLNAAIRFEKVKFKFKDFNDASGDLSYNWYFSGSNGKQVQGFPILSILGEGKIWTYALCDYTPKKSDCEELVKCSFSNVETNLKESVLVPVTKDEIESLDDMFGYWNNPVQDSSGFDITLPPKIADVCAVRVVFGLCAGRTMASKTKLEWSCEGWKEPNKITEIDFLLALPVRKLLKGQQFEEKYEYEHPDVPGLGKLTIAYYPSD